MRGKKRTAELHHFIYHLESNLNALNTELTNRIYKHGQYRLFSVNDTKRRDIAVASIKDRFVHRLLYEYLVKIYDKTFVYDIWSCREEKGLLKAIERAQDFIARNHHGYFWRGDVQKFFDSVNQNTLRNILHMRVEDNHALWLLDEVITSYPTRDLRERERERERVLLNLGGALPSAT